MRSLFLVAAFALFTGRAFGDKAPPREVMPTCKTFDGRPGDIVKIMDDDGGVTPRCVGRQEATFGDGQRIRSPEQSAAAVLVITLAVTGALGIIVARKLLRKPR